MKTSQLRTSKSCLFRACYSKGVSCHHLHFGRGSRQAEECESFTLHKREGLGVPSFEVVGMGKLEAG